MMIIVVKMSIMLESICISPGKIHRFCATKNGPVKLMELAQSRMMVRMKMITEDNFY